MTRRPETVAWMVLWGAFLVFCALAVTIPLGVRWYIQNATDVREGVVSEIGRGTLQITPVATGIERVARKGEKVREGDAVRTEKDSTALLSFFDDSVTVQLLPDTTVYIIRLRTAKFGAQANSCILWVDRSKGDKARARIGVSPLAGATTYLEVITPQAQHILLSPDGSYAVEVRPGITQVSTRKGEARVNAQNATLLLNDGYATEIVEGQTPGTPQRALQPLLAAGDFTPLAAGAALPENWVAFSRKEVADDVEGQVQLVNSDNAGAIQLKHGSGRNKHTETGIVQEVQWDVSDFVSLRLSLEAQVRYQSLSGGGFLGSEYPLLIHITYKGADGKEYKWARGFYYQNPEDYPTTNGRSVGQNAWYTYTAELLAPRASGPLQQPSEQVDTAGMGPPPVYIFSIEVMASGWDYESLVRRVSLVAE
ncbi:MAG: hypothetical protein FJZ89_10395 [Chloroflexi bacterium]|nr:hypothetical protein [Chloroflexota bacterium]